MAAEPITAGLNLGKSFLDMVSLIIKKNPDFPQKVAEDFDKMNTEYWAFEKSTREYAQTDFYPDVLSGKLNDLKEMEKNINNFSETWLPELRNRMGMANEN